MAILLVWFFATAKADVPEKPWPYNKFLFTGKLLVRNSTFTGHHGGISTGFSTLYEYTIKNGVKVGRTLIGTLPIGASEYQENGFSPQLYSPNGKLLLGGFSKRVGDDIFCDLAIMDVATRKVRRLTHDQQILIYDWSPDSRKLMAMSFEAASTFDPNSYRPSVYAARNKRKLFLIDVPTGKIAEIDRQVFWALWRPDGRGLLYVKATRNGKITTFQDANKINDPQLGAAYFWCAVSPSAVGKPRRITYEDAKHLIGPLFSKVYKNVAPTAQQWPQTNIAPNGKKAIIPLAWQSDDSRPNKTSGAIFEDDYIRYGFTNSKDIYRHIRFPYLAVDVQFGLWKWGTQSRFVFGQSANKADEFGGERIIAIDSQTGKLYRLPFSALGMAESPAAHYYIDDIWGDGTPQSTQKNLGALRK